MVKFISISIGITNNILHLRFIDAIRVLDRVGIEYKLISILMVEFGLEYIRCIYIIASKITE